jgi:hypothetical protein
MAKKIYSLMALIYVNTKHTKWFLAIDLPEHQWLHGIVYHKSFLIKSKASLYKGWQARSSFYLIETGAKDLPQSIN